jgi:glycine oxidase
VSAGALPEHADVVVIGAGAAGLALAFELARRGVQAVVVERGAPSSRASSALGAAAGLVNAQGHPGVDPEPVRDLALLSRHLYADWIESIEEEAGVSCEYDVRGGLTVALSDIEEVQLDRSLDWQRARALPFEVLPAEEARAREPGLGGGVRAAFSFPLDGHVNPQRLGPALALAAQRAGATLVTRTPALALSLAGGRASGVETSSGRIAAGAVVNAAGAWATHLAGAPALPVAPVRGQLVLLDASEDPDRLTRFVHAVGVYLVPRRDGTVVVGSTRENAGFDARPTAGGVTALLEKAARVVPAVAGYAFLEAWAGLRPSSPDDVPLLGETAVPGYYLAAGLYGSGVLLAPGAAVVLADLLTGQTPPLPPAPFSPARFDV